MFNKKLETRPKVNILVCHHKEGEYISSKCIVPIQVGRKNSNVKLEYCVGDDTGDNISHKNKNWCELTALYWQWKNIDADYYGLFHYRRYLSFKYSGDDVYNESSLSSDVINEHGWDDKNVLNVCSKYDVITAPEFNIHPAGIPDMIMSSYDFYAREHVKKDLDDIILIVKNKYNFFYESLVCSLSDKKCYFGNIQIMKKEYYFEYCEILFGILEEFEKNNDLDKYDSYQSRVYGFLAERISNAYLFYLKNKVKNLKFNSFSLVCLYPFNSKKLNFFKTNNGFNFKDEDINVCLTFDNKYLYHGMTAINSVIDNNNSNSNLHIYILHDENLTADSISIIDREFFASKVKINFILVNNSIFKNFPLNRGHITINTYFRLLICSLLPDLDKVIYIDSDVVVLGNIANLWEVDLNNKCIGAALDEGGIIQSRRLGLDSDYFNAGILVFNLKRIRYLFDDPFNYFFECYNQYRDRITLQDQDILNIAFKDEVKLISLAWNMNSRIFSQNILDHKYNDLDEIEALSSIGILHYTDTYKPWKFFCRHPYAKLYWKYRFRLKNKNISFLEYIAFLNHVVFRFNYIVYGAYVIFNLFGVKIKLSKSMLKKVVG